MPSGRAVNVAVSDDILAESTSVIVANGAINTAVCSVKAALLSLPATPPFRSVTGASFVAVMVTVEVCVVLVAAPVPPELASVTVQLTVRLALVAVGLSLVLL